MSAIDSSSPTPTLPTLPTPPPPTSSSPTYESIIASFRTGNQVINRINQLSQIFQN